jgi:hypothetical protein
MFVLLGVQLALALAGVAALVGLGNAMSGHAVPFAHDDVPMLFPAMAVVVLGVPALLLAARNHRALSRTLAFAPYPVAVALMLWGWL